MIAVIDVTYAPAAAGPLSDVTTIKSPTSMLEVEVMEQLYCSQVASSVVDKFTSLAVSKSKLTSTILIS